MDKQYYKIGEAAKIIGVRESTLRFWETEFPQIKPQKLSGNQRYYSQKDIEILKSISNMLYVEKLTIEGAKKKLRLPKKDNNGETISSFQNQEVDLQSIKKELIEILKMLD